MKKSKYYMLSQKGKEADLYIFGDITSEPLENSDVSSYQIVQELNALDASVINVHINSYGGEVSEALAILNTLLRLPATVNTFVDGFACSAATVVFMAGNRRVMGKYSNFLVHSAWADVIGNADDLRKTADDLDRITEQSIKAYMDRIGRRKTREELLELMKEERFLTPEECIEWGFATEIDQASAAVSARASQSAKRLVFDKIQASQQAKDKNISALEKLRQSREKLSDNAKKYGIDASTLSMAICVDTTAAVCNALLEGIKQC